jgi:hypothetical protein
MKESLDVCGICGIIILITFLLLSVSKKVNRRQTMAEKSILIEKFSPHIGKGCPVCNRGIELGQIVVLCTRCKAPHHEDCWYNAGGCGKVGCNGVATKRSTSVQDSLAAASFAKRAEARKEEEEQAKSQALSNAISVIIPLLILGALLYYIFFLR